MCWLNINVLLWRMESSSVPAAKESRCVAQQIYISLKNLNLLKILTNLRIY
jgi:hypothetical protein